MQPQSVDDCLLQQVNLKAQIKLRRIFSFPVLIRNHFLLKKFDSTTGFIRLSCLAKENSFRQLLEYPNGMQNLMNILFQFNYTNWFYDQNFNAVLPIFSKERKQVQILIKKNQVEEFKKFLQELEVKQEWEPREAEYVPNKDMIKLFIVFETKEDAQIGFGKIQQSKSIYGIQNAKMEEVDYFSKFLSIVATKQQQFQEQRINNMRNYEDRNYDETSNQFQNYSQQQQPQQQIPQQQQSQQVQEVQQVQQQSQQQPQQSYQQEQQFYDYSSSDIVSQRLNQIRTKDKVELNFAPLQEQQFQFSFAPIFYPQQDVQQQEVPINPQQQPQPELQPQQEQIQVEQPQEQPSAGQPIEQTDQKQPRETESNKENSVEKNHGRKYDEGRTENYQKPYYQNRYQVLMNISMQQKRRPNNESYQHSNKYYDNSYTRKPQQHYSNIELLISSDRLENDLREFTGYKKYSQRPQKEYYEPKRES
ncbi:unnamed protein product (macronuclear) [Paramecium tetraurelia]|uniref:Uncharacterized protein n=1 Tax=Paramecium tetraurelia TaxID=5888 RepID=A0C835_PARTE|nr:uncharacterized protein GSPATT00036083001 [Paramecium tetraurelia]CAK66952.1 unnamed protein product [Paramecium tetraurelia]|eukprot:XP_001434349.1 hypothetical protein (macronuclear) [Paramecium tetraurelia strain d4-2]